MKERLVLVISKTWKNCWVSWKNRKRSDGLWAIIWLCRRMRKVVYITAGYFIFGGQQKKSPFLARPHLQSSRGPPGESPFLHSFLTPSGIYFWSGSWIVDFGSVGATVFLPHLLPSLYVVTSSHLVWERSRLILSAVKHLLSWETLILSTCLQVQFRRDWIKFRQVVGDHLL